MRRRSIGIAIACVSIACFILVHVTGCGKAPSPKGAGINPAYEKLPRFDAVSRDPTVACVLFAVERSSSELEADLELNELDYVHNDAKQLLADFHLLGLPQENIHSLTDADATVEAATDLLDKVSQKLHSGDTLFVLFLGHGMGEKRPEMVFHDKTMPVEDLLRRLGQASGARTVLILDACHSGKPGYPQFPLSSEDFTSAGGVAWMASAKSDQKAFESPALRHGVFSHHLSKILQNSEAYDDNHNGKLEFIEIAEPLQQLVHRWSLNNRTATEQEPIFGVVNWTGEQSILPVRRDWAIEMVEMGQEAKVRVQFPVADLQPGDRVCIVVAPRETYPKYYPQAHIILGPEDGPVWTGMVYLGKDGGDIGKQFTILVLVADAGLLHSLGQVEGDHGLMSPRIDKLPVKTSLTVIRKH